MPQLNLQDLPIHYDDRGKGPAVILIHSFPHDRRVWEAQSEALSKNYRVITPDLPGFGKSTLPTQDFSIDFAAEYILELVERLELYDFVIGGISMGGYVSLAVIDKAPARVAGLILCDTKAAADTEETKKKRNQLIRLVEEQGPKELVEAMLPSMLDPDAPEQRKEAVEQVKKIMSEQSASALVAGHAALRDRNDYRPVLSKIDFPVLLLYGDQDQIVNPSMAEELRGQLKNAQVKIIPQAGHISSIEQPEPVTDAIRSFLKTIHFKDHA